MAATPNDPRLLGPAPGDDVLRLYINNVGVRGGPFDVTLDLGQGYPPATPDDPQTPPQWLARVSMSWEHAIALRMLLDDAIKKYEDLVGQLPDVEKLKVEGQP